MNASEVGQPLLAIILSEQSVAASGSSERQAEHLRQLCPPETSITVIPPDENHSFEAFNAVMKHCEAQWLMAGFIPGMPSPESSLLQAAISEHEAQLLLSASSCQPEIAWQSTLYRCSFLHDSSLSLHPQAGEAAGALLLLEALLSSSVVRFIDCPAPQGALQAKLELSDDERAFVHASCNRIMQRAGRRAHSMNPAHQQLLQRLTEALLTMVQASPADVMVQRTPSRTVRAVAQQPKAVTVPVHSHQHPSLPVAPRPWVAWIHAGTPKTGTTSLQCFLHANREALAGQDLYYPLCGQNPEPDYHDHNPLCSQLERFEAPLREELMACGAKQVVISAENLIWYMTSLERLQAFRSWLERIGAQRFEIIIYLRESGALLTSQLQQYVKMGAPALDYATLQDLRRSPLMPLMNSQALLQRWEQVFGEGSMHVRLFERDFLYKGDLLHDFMQVLGVVWQDDFIIPPRQNDSLRLPELVLLQHVNCLVPGDIYAAGTLKQRLAIAIHEGLGGQTQTAYAAPRAVYDAYVRGLRESNEWVRSRYFPERRRLFAQAPSARGSHEMRELQPQLLTGVARSLISLARGGAPPQTPIFRLRGGLGNQLFQYAFARAYGEEHNCEVLLDPRDIMEGAWRADCRHCFAQLQLYRSVLRMASAQELAVIDHRLAQGLEARLSEPPGHIGYFTPGLLRGPQGALIEGYFMTERYFAHLRKALLAELQLCDEQAARFDRRCAQLLQRIRTCPAVAVHVRRGDYLTYGDHLLCSPGFYRRAMGLIAERVEGAQFFVFSNDTQWVREQLQPQLPWPLQVVDLNSEIEGYFDLELMRACRHHITANSTFSWWGAWLCEHPEPIVVVPWPWMQPERNGEFCDIYPERWIRLERGAS